MSRWSRPNGYKDILVIGLPMMVSMGTTTLMQFTDRVFLSNYSLEAISAALPASIASFLFLCFFVGVVNYINVFVAQYTGTGANDKVGSALWHGIWFSLVSGVVMALLWFPAPLLFKLGGHAPAIQELETVYFRIMCLGCWLTLLTSALACFYSGRGITRPIMLTSMAAAAVNIPLDYAMINGLGPFPEMGIAGAAWATVVAWLLNTIFLAVLIFNRKNDQRFGVWRMKGFDRELFKRFMRFGLPGGMEFFLDVFAFTFFIFMIGRIGELELAASNIVFSLDTLAFLPIFGLHIAVSTMVGQAVGRGRPEEGKTAAMSALHLTFLWMWGLAAMFVLFPEMLLNLFRPREISIQDYRPILETGVLLLRFVALYSMFDGVALVLFGAIKGAGDTVFVMKAMGTLSVCVLVIPVIVVVEILDAGVIAAWVCITCYIASLALTAWFRYRQGRWMSMRVIEDDIAP